MTRAAFFDLDKTIIAKSSGLALGKDLYRQGLINRRVLLHGLVAQLVYLLVGADENKMEQMRQKALALTKGWDRAKIEEIVREVMGETIQPIIYREGLELIEDHLSKGHRVYIVSSSPEEIVRPLGELLGVDGVIASRPQVDDEGRYTGELDFYCYGKHKVEAMTELAESQGIDLSESYAYSDSFTDLPMLEAVGHPIAANPDRELRRAAAERGWEVLRFENPVTIRKRLAEIAPSPATTALTGSVALTVAAFAAGYIWIKRRSEASTRPPSLMDRIPAGIRTLTRRR